MDEKVAKWIIEYLLRNPTDEKIINDALSCLPLPKNDNRLQKTVLLRQIESETLNGSVSEKLLELLEIIEELDHREGKIASDLMKEAYCLVAVDCTVRFLEENVEENGKYVETVERIWRNRVCIMDGLASERLNGWLADIEAAVWDSGVCEKIWMRNTRNDALKAVKGYLKEAWESMGPAFLESVAKDGGDTEVGSENPCRTLVVSQGTQKGQAFVRRKHMAVKSRCPRVAEISDAEKGEDAEQSMNVENDVPAHKIDHRVQGTLQSDSMQLCAAADDIHIDASQSACNMSSTTVKDNTNNVNAVENKTGSVKHATAEVNRVQHALSSSSRELHAAVTDPLPEASKRAETLSPTGVTDNNDTGARNHIWPEMHAIPKVDSVQQAPESSSEKLQAADKNPSSDASVPREPIDKNVENVEKKDKFKENAQGNRVCNPLEQHKRKHSLMERNDTSHTLEWNDSIDNLSGGLEDGLRIPPSPNRSNASALRQSEDKKFRRLKKKWTPQEEDALRDAVKKFGHRWTMIRSFYNEVFKDRTDVDLKDKWRNLLRSQR